MKDSPKASTARWRAGIVLMVANVPFALGSAAICGVLAASFHDPRWLVVGVGAYALSWVMLGIGMLLAGREGLEYARELRHRWTHRR